MAVCLETSIVRTAVHCYINMLVVQVHSLGACLQSLSCCLQASAVRSGRKRQTPFNVLSQPKCPPSRGLVVKGRRIKQSTRVLTSIHCTKGKALRPRSQQVKFTVCVGAFRRWCAIECVCPRSGVLRIEIKGLSCFLNHRSYIVLF